MRPYEQGKVSNRALSILPATKVAGSITLQAKNADLTAYNV